MGPGINLPWGGGDDVIKMQVLYNYSKCASIYLADVRFTRMHCKRKSMSVAG